jgi:hypothetical protein
MGMSLKSKLCQTLLLCHVILGYTSLTTCQNTPKNYSDAVYWFVPSVCGEVLLLFQTSQILKLCEQIGVTDCQLCGFLGIVNENVMLHCAFMVLFVCNMVL